MDIIISDESKVNFKKQVDRKETVRGEAAGWSGWPLTSARRYVGAGSVGSRAPAPRAWQALAQCHSRALSFPVAWGASPLRRLLLIPRNPAPGHHAVRGPQGTRREQGPVSSIMWTPVPHTQSGPCTSLPVHEGLRSHSG